MKLWAFLAIITIVGFFSACVQSSDTIKVGAVLSFTGPAALFGQEARRGIDLAVLDINADGGIRGKQVEIIYEDDATNPSKAVTAFQKLVNVDNVEAIIGGTWDFNYNAIAPLAETHKIALVTPQNLKTEGLQMNGYTLVMQTELRKVIQTLDTYFEAEHIEKVALIRFVSPFGDAISKGLQDRSTVVLEDTYDSIGSNDFRTSITKVKASTADAVFIDMVGPDVINFMSRAKELSLEIPVLSYVGIEDAIANSDFDLEHFEDIVYVDWSQPESQEFIDSYKAQYGKNPGHSADSAYDSMAMLAEAIGQSSSREGVASYIQQHSFTTKNGEFHFTNNVIDKSEIQVKKITKDGIEVLYVISVQT